MLVISQKYEKKEVEADWDSQIEQRKYIHKVIVKSQLLPKTLPSELSQGYLLTCPS